jgi:hypothetical protein
VALQMRMHVVVVVTWATRHGRSDVQCLLDCTLGEGKVFEVAPQPSNASLDLVPCSSLQSHGNYVTIHRRFVVVVDLR